MPTDFVDNLLSESCARIEHGEDDTEDVEPGVQVPLYEVQGFHQAGEAFEGHVFDTEGSAGQIYRLYQTAFDRAPDLAGFGGWLHLMDHGMVLEKAASGFVGSVEFQSIYGESPTDAQFVTLLYNNALARPPDPSGYDYWTDQLAHGMSREQVLIGFSESAENQAALIGAIENGMAYLPV